MKKIRYKILITLILGLIVISCDDFLDEEPLDKVTIGQLYDTNTDLEQAIAGVYSNLSHNNEAFRRGRFQYFLELRTDAMMLGGTRRSGSRLEVATFNYSAGNSYIWRVWEWHYNGINNANIIIDLAPNATNASVETKRRVLGEAHFLRAYFYFNLVRLWGPVPLILKSPESIDETREATRNEISNIYEQIIEDCKYATGEMSADIGLPETGTNDGRVALSAAHTLLADVYLTRGNYSEAARYAKLVMDGGKHALWEEYADAFDIELQYSSNGAPNAENIFDVKFNPDVDPGSRFATESWPRNLIQPYSAAPNRRGEGYYEVDESVYTRLDDNDSRKGYLFPQTYPLGSGSESILVEQEDTIKGGPYDGQLFNRQNPYFCVKYSSNHPRTRYGWGANPWPVYRYADVLLIYLEAVNEQGAAGQDVLDQTINLTRARGGLAPLSAGLGQGGIRDAIKEERFIEFFFEGKRFFDLVRWGDLVEAVNNRNFDYSAQFDIDDRYALLPIPQRELDTNPNLGENNAPWN